MKAPTVAILCIGNEVVDGRIVNTNASWLSSELKVTGFLPQMVTSCRDTEEEIVEMLTFLAERSDHIITSGGLGPTSDDLTRQAIAQFIGVDLVEDEQQLSKLKQFYEGKGRSLDPFSTLQAHVPRGAVIIDNPVGTAPGFITETPSNRKIFTLPGVPKELKHLFHQTVLPTLLESESSKLKKTDETLLQCFGIPESVAGKKIQELNLSSELTIGYRPHFPELEVRLEAPEGSSALKEGAQKIRDEFKDVIFSERINDTVPKALHRLLQQQDKTISVAESCTGGLLGKLLTEESGASAFFVGGFLTYSNALKNSLLGVSEATLETHGAVSPECAREMAVGARKNTAADISLSITGIAGPDGGTEEKPVGLFYIGVASEGFEKALKFFLPYDRDYVRTYAAYAALDTLRRHLLGLPYLGSES